MDTFDQKLIQFLLTTEFLGNLYQKAVTLYIMLNRVKHYLVVIEQCHSSNV